MRSPSPTGAVAFGAVVTLLAGVLVELGARAGGVEPRPVWTWRFGLWVERALLVVVYVLLLFVVAATLTSGGTGGAANPYSGAVFLSFLAALGGAVRGPARVRPDDLGGHRRRSGTRSSARWCCWSSRWRCR